MSDKTSGGATMEDVGRVLGVEPAREEPEKLTADVKLKRRTLTGRSFSMVPSVFEFAFGIDSAATAKALRQLADRIDTKTALPQGVIVVEKASIDVIVVEKASIDDWFKTTLILKLIEKA